MAEQGCIVGRRRIKGQRLTTINDWIYKEHDDMVDEQFEQRDDDEVFVDDDQQWTRGVSGEREKSEQWRSGHMTSLISTYTNEPNLRHVFFMRTAERIDRVFPHWLDKAFKNDGYTYAPKDMNMPASLPRRGNYLDNYKLDPPITVFGQMMSQQFGRYLRAQQVNLDYVYCSPALRCIQTAACFLFAYSHPHPKIRIEPGLFEPTCWYERTDVIVPDFVNSKLLDRIGYSIDMEYEPLVPVNLGPGQHIARALSNEREPSYNRLAFTVDRLVKSTFYGNVLIVGHAITMDAGYRCLLGKGPQPIKTADLYKMGVYYPYCSTLVAQQKNDDIWIGVDDAIPLLSYHEMAIKPDLEFANR